jgi:hypothetical protein
MKKIFFLAAILGAFVCCGNNPIYSGQKSLNFYSPDGNSIKKNVFSGFVHFKGAIDNKYPYTANLYFSGDKIKGTSYYDKVGAYINIEGNIKDDSVIFYEKDYKNGKTTGIFKGKILNTTIKGKWFNSSQTKELPFYLKATKDSCVLTRHFNFHKLYKEKGKNDYSLSYNVEIPIASAYPDKFKTIKDALSDFIIGITFDKISDINSYFDEIAQKSPYSDGDAETTDDLECTQIDSTASGVIYNTNCYFSFYVYTYGYFCDIDGRYSTTLFCFDLQSGKQLKWNDILEINPDTLLNMIANALLQGDVSEEDLETVDLFIPDNFCINEDGIIFKYGVNDPFPFAFGEPEAFIDYNELLPYLKEDFKNRIIPN